MILVLRLAGLFVAMALRLAAVPLLAVVRALSWTAGFLTGLCREPFHRARQPAQRAPSGEVVPLVRGLAQRPGTGQQVGEFHKPSLRVLPGGREGSVTEEFFR